MRIHVTLRGEATTISVDEVLVDYFGAWLAEESPEQHRDAKKQHDQAIASIKRMVRNFAEKPQCGLSQHVQHRILAAVMPDKLTEILKMRGPRYARPSVPKRTPSEADRQAAEAQLAAFLSRR